MRSNIVGGAWCELKPGVVESYCAQMHKSRKFILLGWGVVVGIGEW